MYSHQTMFVLMRRFAGYWLGIVVVVLVAGVSSCSMVRLAYGWADWLLERQVNRYLDLTSQQSNDAQRAIDAYVQWHRTTMLPRYAQFLRRQAQLHRSGTFDTKAFDAARREINDLYAATVEPAVPTVVALVKAQSAPQLNHLEEALRERHSEILEEMAATSPAQRIEQRTERFVDFFERFVGELTAAQRARVVAHAATLFADPGPWLADRQRRNNELVRLARARAPDDTIGDHVLSWWVDPARSAPEAYQQYARRFMARMMTMFRQLLMDLTPAQRTHLVETFEGYADDFTQLSGRLGAGAADSRG